MALTRPTITGWSNFWSDLGDMRPYDLLPLAADGNRSQLEFKLARAFHRPQLREFVAVARALNGAAAGGTATSTYKRRQAQTITPIDVGNFAAGNAAIETVTAVNRVTTAADVSYVDDVMSGKLTPSSITYPAAVGIGQAGVVNIAGF